MVGQQRPIRRVSRRRCSRNLLHKSLRVHRRQSPSPTVARCAFPPPQGVRVDAALGLLPIFACNLPVLPVALEGVSASSKVQDVKRDNYYITEGALTFLPFSRPRRVSEGRKPGETPNNKRNYVTCAGGE